MIWNILFWASILWLPALMHGMLCNEAKFKKNIVVGVTLPRQAREDPEVLALLAQMKRQSLWLCLLLTAAAVPCLFIRRFAVSYILWCLWLLAAIAAANLPYILCNRKLRALKRRRGWRGMGGVADLKTAAQPVHWLSPWHFAVPLAVSLLPLLADRSMWILYLSGGGAILLFWACYRYAYRSRSEAVDENTVLTETLTRIRRRSWNRCWLWSAWWAAALNLSIWLTRRSPAWMLAAILLLSAGLLLVVLGVELNARRLQEKLTEAAGGDWYVDEDDQWIAGLFYYNPHDSHLMVNNRVGIGTTVNLAKRAGQVLAAATLLILLLLPLSGAWFLQLEQTPVTLTLTETALTAEHSGTRYEIPLDEIRSVELLEELPAIQRMWGTGMDSVQKGSYGSQWGALTVCLDPRTGPYLLIRMQNGTRYLVGSTDGGAAGILDALQIPAQPQEG